MQQTTTFQEFIQPMLILKPLEFKLEAVVIKKNRLCFDVKFFLNYQNYLSHSFSKYWKSPRHSQNLLIPIFSPWTFVFQRIITHLPIRVSKGLAASSSSCNNKKKLLLLPSIHWNLEDICTFSVTGCSVSANSTDFNCFHSNQHC